MTEEQIKVYNKPTVFGDSLYNYYKFISWARWYPDLFLDLLKPKTGGISLSIDERVFLRCDMRFYSMYGTFSRGYGKCVKGDSLIYTDDGIMEIGGLFDYQSDGKETYYDTKVNMVNRYGELEQSALGLYNGKQDCITVKTDEGFEITGTKVHRVLVMSESGEIIFKMLSDIKCGDYVLINRKNDRWGKNKCTEVRQYLKLDEISRDILTAPKKDVTDFLQKLFDLNGFIGDDSVYFLTDYRKFARQMQIILLNYGIISSLKEVDCSYRISISEDNIKLFRSNIGFGLTAKIKALDNLCEKDFTNTDTIPYQTQIIESLADKCRIEESFTGNLTYDQLEDLLNKCSGQKGGLEYSQLSFLLEQKYYFSRVNEISTSIEDVYDFHLPQTHSFVSNGMISHNTFCEVLAAWVVAILFPGSAIAISAQTKENAGDLLMAKSTEVLKLYPLIQNELQEPIRFTKGYCLITFKNGSIIDNLGNSQSSKGQRRTRLKIEESALLNNALYEDVLEPIPEVPRYTVGELGIADPCELNHQINFYTTSGFRGSDEYQRSCDMYDDMCDLKGSIVLGANWMLPCYYGRGSNKSKILSKKKTTSPLAFEQNYEQNWVGSSSGALVDIFKLMNCRSLAETTDKATSENEEYYIGVDVARSQSRANNQSAIVVARVNRSKGTGRVRNIEIPYILSVSNVINFTNQACMVKKIKNAFNARMVVVDGNGIGAGLIDELLKSAYDPNTNDYLGCWNTVNTSNVPELDDAEKCVFDLKATSLQTKIIADFIDVVTSEKLRLLVNRNDGDFSKKEMEDFDRCVMPFVQTNLLFEEISNLKLKHLSSGALTVERVVRKMDKDRWSALAYVIYYIKEYCDFAQAKEETSTKSILSMARRPSIVSR